jgi:hypothetical protein
MGWCKGKVKLAIQRSSPAVQTSSFAEAGVKVVSLAVAADVSLR